MGNRKEGEIGAIQVLLVLNAAADQVAAAMFSVMKRFRV
jgi:hypothetical protein